jgi:hypothetical protein
MSVACLWRWLTRCCDWEAGQVAVAAVVRLVAPPCVTTAVCVESKAVVNSMG